MRDLSNFYVFHLLVVVLGEGLFEVVLFEHFFDLVFDDLGEVAASVQG